jgi:hypothetical protein
LYCGKRLALLKKLTGGGEFCSDAHKQSYHEEYNKLALNRLMEAQTRQEDRPAHQPGAGAVAESAPEKPAFVEPTARGGYFKQPVTARAPAGAAASASPAKGPAGWPIELPAAAELLLFAPGFAAEPRWAGVIMEHRAVSGGSAVIAPAPDFPQTCRGPGCALPEQHFEIDTAVVPATAGPVAFDACPALPQDPELREEPASGFQFSWEIPERLNPDWVDGLEFASSEEKLATLALGGLRQPAASEETAEDSGAAPVMEEESAPAPALEPILAKYALASATPEPVIDEALLLSLLGGKDEAAPPPAAAPPADEAARLPAPAPAPDEAMPLPPSVAEADDAADDGTAPLPESVAAFDEAAPLLTPAPAPAVPEIAQAQADPSAPAADTAGGPVSYEPGSFLPVTIRPVGAPSKPRLMQSFQAMALVTASPQMPAWNMLPLRPRMALGRGPGPGAGLLNRGKTEAGAPAEARKPGSAGVGVANEPESSADLAVPTFGLAGKPRTGLSRWFKLSILAGVLGIAGGSSWLFHPAEMRGARVAEAASKPAAKPGARHKSGSTHDRATSRGGPSAAGTSVLAPQERGSRRMLGMAVSATEPDEKRPGLASDEDPQPRGRAALTTSERPMPALSGIRRPMRLCPWSRPPQARPQAKNGCRPYPRIGRPLWLRPWSGLPHFELSRAAKIPGCSSTRQDDGAPAAGTGSPGALAEARQHITTEFAAWRN